MKIKAIPLIIVLGISAVISYALYSFCKSDNATLLAICGGVMSFATLATAFGITIDRQGKSVNIRVLSLVFFMLMMISNTIFANLAFKTPTYIIINGLLFLIWLLIVYSISKADVK